MTFPSKEHQFKPGVSGNPGGRPKGASTTAELRAYLAELAADAKGEPTGKTHRRLVAEALVSAAEAGDVPAIREVFNRDDGRSRQSAPEQADSTLREAALARLRAIHDADGLGTTDGGAGSLP